MSGEESGLVIQLEDDNLSYEIYKQIISKIYSVIRYTLYQDIKEKTMNFSSNLDEEELKEVVRILDVEKIRISVFGLFKIKRGLDT